MKYLIETKVKNISYYIKTTYEGARYPDFKFEGLKDNATHYGDYRAAYRILQKIQIRTKNILKVIPK